MKTQKLQKIPNSLRACERVRLNLNFSKNSSNLSSPTPLLVQVTQPEHTALPGSIRIVGNGRESDDYYSDSGSAIQHYTIYTTNYIKLLYYTRTRVGARARTRESGEKNGKWIILTFREF